MAIGIKEVGSAPGGRLSSGRQAMCKWLSLALMTPQQVGGVGCEVGEMDSG